jgi:hypothetical protein
MEFDRMRRVESDISVDAGIWMEFLDGCLRWVMRQLLRDHGNGIFSGLGIWSCDYNAGVNADFLKVNIMGFLLVGSWSNSNKISRIVRDGA